MTSDEFYELAPAEKVNMMNEIVDILEHISPSDCIYTPVTVDNVNDLCHIAGELWRKYNMRSFYDGAVRADIVYAMFKEQYPIYIDSLMERIII